VKQKRNIAILMFAFSLAFAESIFKKSILKINKNLKKVFWKYKIKYYLVFSK